MEQILLVSGNKMGRRPMNSQQTAVPYPYRSFLLKPEQIQRMNYSAENSIKLSNGVEKKESPLLEGINFQDKFNELTKRYNRVTDLLGNTSNLGHVEWMKKAKEEINLGKRVNYGSRDMNLEMLVKRQKIDDDNDVRRREMMMSRLMEIEERKLLLQKEMVELEKEKFEWLKYYGMLDRNLCKTKLENERIKLETERVELEIKRALRK